MDSPALGLVKSDVLLKDIVEKLLFLCLCKFCGFHFYDDMPTLTDWVLNFCKVFEKNHYIYNQNLYFFPRDVRGGSVVMISVIHQKYEQFNLILYLFNEDYKQPEATSSSPQHRYRQ